MKNVQVAEGIFQNCIFKILIEIDLSNTTIAILPKSGHFSTDSDLLNYAFDGVVAENLSKITISETTFHVNSIDEYSSTDAFNFNKVQSGGNIYRPSTLSETLDSWMWVMVTNFNWQINDN